MKRPPLKPAGTNEDENIPLNLHLLPLGEKEQSSYLLSPVGRGIEGEGAKGIFK